MPAGLFFPVEHLVVKYGTGPIAIDREIVTRLIQGLLPSTVCLFELRQVVLSHRRRSRARKSTTLAGRLWDLLQLSREIYDSTAYYQYG